MTSATLILKGTAEELERPHAQKVIAAAKYANVPLSCETVTAEECASISPLAKSLVLCYGDVPVTTSNAMMRTIATLSPASCLLGTSAAEDATIDGWLSFIWTSIDLPLSVAGDELGDNSAVEQDVAKALETIEKYLTESKRAYMVGNSLSLADISLAVSLSLASLPSAKPSEGSVLGEYLSSITPKLDTTSASSIVTPSGGIMLNGPCPPVDNKLYRRHRIRIKELLANGGKDYIDQTVTVAGWARTTRNANKGQLLFVELNDGSIGESLQCVLDAEKVENLEECKACGGTGASFQLVGTIIASPGEGQAVELAVSAAKLLGAVYGGDVEGNTVGGKLYPMSKKAHTLEYMREHAHLRPRGRIHSAAMRIRHAMAYATHTFFHNNGFLYIHTPILTGADCEGAGEQFGVTTLLGSDHLQKDVTLPVIEPPPEEDQEKLSKKELKRRAKAAEKAKVTEDPTKPVEEKVVGAVDYSKDFFGKRVNLTVSGQLNVETHACALSDVYTFGPTFRAENSHTGRHLAEFWMIEPEICFADLADDINLAEDYLKYCVKFALENCADDLEFFETSPHGEEGLRDRLKNVLDNPFVRLTYTQAIEVLQKAVAEDGVKFEEEPVWGIDLPSEHERYLCEKVYKKPVVLTDYPKDIKAFYMKLNEDEKTVAAADILVPKIGEIIGGSQREHRLDVLKKRCEEMGLDPRQVWWYLDLRRYGTVPHAGFGLGFERLILFITGLQNIRDVIPFPRYPQNAEF
ncbi:asparaginyl-tRNA synthetase [Nitzschia inconspicua]|uniref:asparagine--tRNA ligase n=1 Tax=Nitzschia inconspicua TaxID=303405 RepID=A0A9K3LZN6_9STRA|nr:asparaginyl-tRNA synthetase [Nitzschia inconspicua]